MNIDHCIDKYVRVFYNQRGMRFMIFGKLRKSTGFDGVVSYRVEHPAMNGDISFHPSKICTILEDHGAVEITVR